MYTVYQCVFRNVCLWENLCFMFIASRHPSLYIQGGAWKACWWRKQQLRKRENPFILDKQTEIKTTWPTINTSNYSTVWYCFHKPTVSAKCFSKVNIVNKQLQWQQGLFPVCLLGILLSLTELITLLYFSRSWPNFAKCAAWNINLTDSYLAAIYTQCQHTMWIKRKSRSHLYLFM